MQKRELLPREPETTSGTHYITPLKRKTQLIPDVTYRQILPSIAPAFFTRDDNESPETEASQVRQFARNNQDPSTVAGHLTATLAECYAGTLCKVPRVLQISLRRDEIARPGRKTPAIAKIHGIH